MTERAGGGGIGHRPLTGKKPDEIRSVEDFEKEFAKVDAFVEEIGNDLSGDFHIYKKGFWPKFIETLETRYNREVRPHLNLSMDERRNDFFCTQST